MSAHEDLRNAVRAAIERHPAVNPHQYPITITLREGVLILEGEVESIIAKRLLPHLAAAVEGVHDVLDHLRVAPGEQRGDDAVQDSVYESLIQESAFRNYEIKRSSDNGSPSPSSSGNKDKIIEISVKNGVVGLVGNVESLTHKRLADVLAWWASGSVDVENRLHVVPPEQDNDDEITDALRIVLEKDPWLDAGQIQVHTKDRTVKLEGLLHSHEQKRMAEYNAWYILGVHGVVNHIEVRPLSAVKS